MSLDTFTGIARVRVTDEEHPMVGKFGMVWRQRRCDYGAWVAMDSEVPESVREFPADDPHGRGRHVLLYPDQCEPA